MLDGLLLMFSISLIGSLALARLRVGVVAEDLVAPQASHVYEAPRLGGVPVAAALVLGSFAWFHVSGSGPSFLLFLASASPLFFVGLLEDLRLYSSVRLRLVSAVASGALFVVIFGQWLPRVDIPLVDALFSLPLVAIPFTVLACAGVTHAFNLIDGLNGLSGLVGATAAVCLALIARAGGHDAHFEALSLVAAALAGFLLVNFPFGRLFLGDAGAYCVGHILVWIAVTIVWRDPDVSAFAILLIFFWPVADTLTSIARRVLQGVPISRPDRRHFHQIAMRLVERALGGRVARRVANPLATFLLAPFIVAPAAVGAAFYDSVGVTAAASGLFALLYVGGYLVLSRLAGSWRVRLAPRDGGGSL